MKKIFIVLTLLSLVGQAHSQDIVSRIIKEICNCIETEGSTGSPEERLNNCASDAMGDVLAMETENLEFELSEDSIQKLVSSVQMRLSSECELIRDIVLEYNKDRFYRASENEKANELYYSGNEASRTGNYKEAVRLYRKALKEDPEFIYAIDNLGLAYRKTEKYKKSISLYNKSLAIYPEGSFALQNQAVAYTGIKDYNPALMNYRMLVELYPGDPEGYYGIGKVLVLMDNYDTAIDFVFFAHRIYADQNSEFVKDTAELTAIIYNKMKEEGKTELFNQKAGEYGIKIN